MMGCWSRAEVKAHRSLFTDRPDELKIWVLETVLENVTGCRIGFT